MRKKALLILTVVLAVLVVWLYLARNRLLESAIEATGSALVGARVEVDGLDLDLIHLKASLNRLQVTNPHDTWHNALEFGPSRFDILAKPLAWNRFVVEQFSVTNVRFNSPRRTDGALPATKKGIGPDLFQRAKKSFQAELEQTPAFELRRLASRKVNVDSVLAILEIGVVDSVARLRDELQTDAERWRRTLSELDPRTSLREIRALVEPIRPAKINTLTELRDALGRVNEARKQLQQLSARLDPALEQARVDLNGMKVRFAVVDDWLREDLERARGKLGMPDLRPATISRTLFGRVVVDRLLQAFYWVGVAREAMPYVRKARAVAQAGQVKKPPRGKGVNIAFPLRQRWPKWWFKRILLSATSTRLDTSRRWHFSGEIRNLTSHPAVLNQPTVLVLRGNVSHGGRFRLDGTLDHRTPTPSDQIELALANVRLGKVALPHAQGFPEAVDIPNSSVILTLDLVGDDVDAVLSLDAPNVSFRFAEEKATSAAALLVREVFSSLPVLHVEAAIRGTVERPRFSFRSNLDVVLSSRLRKMLGQQYERARARVENHVRRIAEKQRALLEQWYISQVAPLAEQAESYRLQIENERKFLEEKKVQLEHRIEEERKKTKEKLQKKAKGALENLLQGKRP